MIEIPIFNETGSQVGAEKLDEELLGGEVNHALLKQALVMYQSNLRQGNVAQKTRGEVEGSTRKIFRQKGTGNARMGPIRQPVRRGGGRAFPRKPRDFSRDMPKKMKRLARLNAVLAKAKAQELLIVDRLAFESPKTKRLATFLKAVNAATGCVLATEGGVDVIYKSGRNLPKVTVMDVAGLNAHDILRHRRLIFTRDAYSTFTASAKDAAKAGA